GIEKGPSEVNLGGTQGLVNTFETGRNKAIRLQRNIEKMQLLLSGKLNSIAMLLEVSGQHRRVTVGQGNSIQDGIDLT
ncbi:hypothetical protein C0993_005288, partial [Termitomyces sp. T159_Od127]